MAAKRIKKIAYVHCRGGSNIEDGVRLCKYGCIGCGACENACRLGAVSIGEDGIALVNQDKCVGCGLCAKNCPQGVISIVPADANIQVKCMNQDAGKAAMSACKNACIGCGICEKNCPAGAIHVVDNKAVINEEACIRCGMCAVKCPKGVIRDSYGIMTD